MYQDLENKLSARENETLPYYFIFTRHGFSCNNATDTSGWLKKYLNLFKKVLEPHLTDYGIVRTITVGQKNREKYSSSTVFVSCLLRTWETAILLYLPNLGLNDNLNIIVSPFLKEKHSTFKTGNYPHTIVNKGIQEIDIKTMLDNFIVFLKLLNTNYSHYFNEKKLSKIIVNYNGKSYSIASVFTQTKPKNIFTIQTNKLIKGGANTTIANITGAKQEIIIPEQEQENNTLTLTTQCNPKTISNYLYPNVEFKYYVNNSKENLLLFIQWVTKNIDAGIFSSHNHEIHVVAHSNIMQSFLEIMKNTINLPSNIRAQPILTCSALNNYRQTSNTVNILTSITEQPLYKTIIKTNSWSIESLVTFTKNSLNISISKMTTGVPKLKDTDPSLHELCIRVLNKQIVQKNNLAATSKSRINFGGTRKKNKKIKTKRNKKIHNKTRKI